jgi:hypothetical protein
MSRIQHRDVPKEMIANCMKVCFNGETFDNDFFRFDFMYIAHDEQMTPECFTLCQEINKEHVWLTYGGAVPEQRGMKTVKSFRGMIEELATQYKRIGAQVENTNFAMLKIYIAHEFKISGVRINHTGKTFVEFLKEN